MVYKLQYAWDRSESVERLALFFVHLSIELLVIF